MVMQNIRKDRYFYLKSKKALYNAALTCTSFLEPALDALWYDMSCIKPLFKLLSNFEPYFQANVCPWPHRS